VWDFDFKSVAKKEDAKKKKKKKRGGEGREGDSMKEKKLNDTCNWALTSTFSADLWEKHHSDKNARLLVRQPADTRWQMFEHIFCIIESSALAVTTDINSNFLQSAKCFFEKYIVLYSSRFTLQTRDFRVCHDVGEESGLNVKDTK